MKNKKILNDIEIEKLLNLKYSNLGEAIKQLENQFEDFNLENSKKSQFMFEIATSVNGKIENNQKNLSCPKCHGKYVVSTYAGDLYYRLFNGSQKQKQEEKRRFANMGLHSNPWAIADEFTIDYWCLHCGIRWDGKGKNILKSEYI